MQKIMFNDRFGLTEAVIEKRKTVTRRLINPQPDRARYWNPIYVKDEPMYYQDERGMCQLIDEKGKVIYPPYKVGEIVAVSQSYKDCGEFDVYEAPKDTAGWKNKMFVKAELMPHQIRILGVRAERLQDITDEDCLREGIMPYGQESKLYCYADEVRDLCVWHSSAKEAFAALIDKISGKGTWDSNPFVWVYDFEQLNNEPLCKTHPRAWESTTRSA